MNREPQREPTFFDNVNRAFTGLNHDISKDTQEHLRNVYATVGAGIFSSALGVAFYFLTGFTQGLFFSLASFYLIYKVYTTGPETDANRMAMFLAFCGINGIGLGPLIHVTLEIDGSILLTSILASAAIFGCFTMAALKATSTKYLHLGGTLSSALLFLLFGSFFLSHSVLLWGGLAVACGFILYDTQMIVEKNRRGDNDYLRHALELFIDFANVFRHILILLAQKKDNERRNKRKD
ncbi:unnamed protein product [Auanema sp. JU1783]|nr:unnamed protein product [Auanema sp. JU1783]